MTGLVTLCEESRLPQIDADKALCKIEDQALHFREKFFKCVGCSVFLLEFSTVILKTSLGLQGAIAASISQVPAVLDNKLTSCAFGATMQLRRGTTHEWLWLLPPVAGSLCILGKLSPSLIVELVVGVLAGQCWGAPLWRLLGRWPGTQLQRCHESGTKIQQDSKHYAMRPNYQNTAM